MKVSFVIPIWNNFRLINDLLVQINKHTNPDEIIIVDDCSMDPETLNGVNWWKRNSDNIKVIRPLENLGFLRASNYGISKATGDIVCLISSDVRIETDLVKLVTEIIEADPKVLIGGIMYTHDTGWNTFDGKIFPYLEGWLLCAQRTAWYDLGCFDELFVPNDCEDIDLSTTAVKKGYSLIPLNSPNIRHLGGQSIGYTDERMALTVRNKEKFREKWMSQNEPVSPK